jgi:hypothetical protein
VSTVLPIAAVAALALAGTLARRGARNGAPMPSMAKPFAELPADKRTDVRGAVLYEGPSRIDKEPIIVIMTYTSSNEKTGDIPQVWLLPHGVHPHQARVEGHDTRVCGGCIFAGNRGCYLGWFELKSIQDSYTRGNYSDWDHAAWWMRRNAPSVIRIGAYGDPAAAPLEVWERLAALPSGKPGPSGQASTATLIGYTQLWRSPLARGLERFCMASTKSPTEYADAKRRGWRSFRVALPEDAACAQAQVRCPATDSDEDTCKGCRLCSGGASGPDVMEPIHGNPRVAGKAMAQMRKLKLKEREAKGSQARQRGVCGRCDGRGKIGAFAHYAGGVCFACGGTGELELDPAVSSATTGAKPFREVDLPDLGRAFIERDGAGLTAVVNHGKIWFRVVDGRVIVDVLSDGLRERRVTVRKAQEALQSVLRVRGSAAFGEAEEGVRYKVWHQTSPAAAEAIQRQGFRIDLPRARVSDREMPDGVFLKFTDQKIGVAKDPVQILVEANVRNPLILKDRDQLKSLLQTDEEYNRLLADYGLTNEEFRQKVADLDEEEDRIYAIVYAQRRAKGEVGRMMRDEDLRLASVDERLKHTIEAWSRSLDGAATKVRKRVTELVRSLGHDAVLMVRDEGSFGRTVKTLVVLDPQNVRLVAGSGARVTPTVTQADLDAVRGWWGRGKGAAEDPELQQRIRALGARFDIVPPKVLYRGLSVAPGTIGPQTTDSELARLASGLRSWSKDKRMASAYAKRDLHRNADEVVLIWSQPAKERLVLDAGQLDAAARRGLGVESSLDTSEVIGEASGLQVESVKRKSLGPNRTRVEIYLI